MADPFKPPKVQKIVSPPEAPPQTTPWWANAPIPAGVKEWQAKRQGFSIRRPSGEMAFTAPSTKGVQGLQPSSWQELMFIDPRYKDVLQALSNPSSPMLYSIALKSQTKEPLSIDELEVINEAWKQLASQTAGQQEERATDKWMASQGFGGMSPEKRAFEINQSSKADQESLNRQSENRYIAARQKAEGAAVKRVQAQREEEQQRIQELNSRREALKGPRDWMKYISETGGSPSWIGYWMARKGALNA